MCAALSSHVLTKRDNSVSYEFEISFSLTQIFLDDSGTNMYIILKGSVGVWGGRNSDEIHDKKESTRRSMIESKILTAGSCFGEQTLLNNPLRPYTIVCKESCHVAAFEKQDYFSILGLIPF